MLGGVAKGTSVDQFFDEPLSTIEERFFRDKNRKLCPPAMDKRFVYSVSAAFAHTNLFFLGGMHCAITRVRRNEQTENALCVVVLHRA